MNTTDFLGAIHATRIVPPADFEGIEEIAYDALAKFIGKDAPRVTAEAAFPLWDRYEFITRATRARVLSRFPEPVEREPMPGVDCLIGGAR